MTRRNHHQDAKRAVATEFVRAHVDLTLLGITESIAVQFAMTQEQENWELFFRLASNYKRASLNGSQTPWLDALGKEGAGYLEAFVAAADPGFKRELEQEMALRGEVAHA